VNLSPVADAYVRSGATASQNFGADPTLLTKEDSNIEFDRRSFLRFDLSQISGNVERATLRLIPTAVGTTIENRVSYVANDSWGETIINWNNQPAALPFGGDFVKTGSSFEIMVTPLVQEAVSGDKRLSLRIDSPINLGASGIVTFGSKENTSAALRPILILEMTPASITNRRVFYNRSASTAFGNGTDNPINAIDPTKFALLPGETVATTANYTNYSRGLNGIIVDVANPITLAGILAGSFQFAMWSAFPDSTPNFVSINPAVTVSTFAGGGLNGSDRVKLEFADNAIQNAWLRVTMLANANTGLASNDVFYFGNARLDVTPNTTFPSQVAVNVLDTNLVRARNGTDPNNVSNIYDVDRSGSVNVLDTNATRAGNGVNSLRPFTAPLLPQANLLLALQIDSAFADTGWIESIEPESTRRRSAARRF
jgi:hypothetical protein